MMIVASEPPNFRTISYFHKRHLKILAGLFVQVLKLADTAGLVKLGHLALDGTNVTSNASKPQAMSYAPMKKREAEQRTDVDRRFAVAEAADAKEDKLRANCRDDELRKWIADKEQ